MAADGTYQPAIRRLQGGNTLESSTAGTIDSYGTIQNRGTLTNTGTITNSSDGRVRNQHNAYVASSTAALGNILPYGHALVGSSSAGAHVYKLQKPAATGDRMTIICRGSSGALTIVPATGAHLCKFMGTKLFTKFTFGANAKGAAVDLVAVTSTNWGVVGWSTLWTTTIKCT